MSHQQIRYDVADRIATITLHRPEKLNAFTAVMRDELVDAFGQADADDGVRAVIVTGAGRAFCAGADLSAGAATFDYAKKEGLTAETHRDGGGRVSLRIFEMKKPVIAAVNGPAVGIGATMQLPMDIRIASSEARFGFVNACRQSNARRPPKPEQCADLNGVVVVVDGPGASPVHDAGLLGKQAGNAGTGEMTSRSKKRGNPGADGICQGL